MDKCSGKRINYMVSEIEETEIRATKELKSFKLSKIKTFRVNCRTALALSALPHAVWSRETAIKGDAN